MNKLTGWDDTIVAIATPPGVGAIAVIRLSGKESFRIINELFPSKDIYELPSHTIHIGLLKDNGMDLDEVVLSIFKGPKSYTGEDVIEISCHGSPFVQQQIIEACIRHGARLAKPGEFTQRAFLQGKLDLTQSEAVADLIAAGTGAAQKTALQGIRGGFAQKLREMREELIQFAALVELELDFATEDVEFADRAKFRSLVEKISENTGKLAESFKLGNVIKNGVSVAIIGKPNSGKSTLLNTLLNENRAIVSEIAGTTRDTIEEVVNINGILFRLIDTAGIRAHSSDVIENIGMEKSREKMRTADLVLYLFDSREETKESLQQQVEILNAIPVKYLLVANKSDLGSNNKIDLRGIPVYSISALQEKGMEELKKGIYASTVDTTVAAGDTIITNARHYEALLQLSESLSAIRSGLDRNLPGDLLAPDIRQALYYLGEITGEVTNEDKLDYIFSKFCIGK